MLELIVLGQIPGTGVVVSYQSVLIAAGLFASAILIYSLLKRRVVLNSVIDKKAKA